MKKGNVTLVTSLENLQVLHRIAARHLLDTGEKLTLVQTLDKVISRYVAQQPR